MMESGRVAVLVSVASAAGAVIGVIVSPLVAYWTNERQMDVKMLEIGVGILRTPPQEGGEAMRTWAVDVVEKGTRRPFTEAQRAQLLRQELQLRWDMPIKWDAPIDFDQPLGDSPKKK